MKLKSQLSPKQKNALRKTPQILLAIVLLGVLSTQINVEKDLSAMEDVESIANSTQSAEVFGAEEIQVDESASAANNALAKSAAAAAQTATTTTDATAATAATAAKSTAVASPKSIVKTSSTVAYAQMNMAVSNYTGKLQWSSSFQRNIKNFIVERSIDYEEFSEIGKIAGEGAGEFRQKKSYEFNDSTMMYVQMPRVFYRLKEQGLYGDTGYSDIVEYDMGLPEGLYARVEKNKQNQLLIHYAAPSVGKVDYQILNTFGDLVLSGELDGDFDAQSFLVETDNWEKGSYYLKLAAGKYSFMETFEFE